MFFKEFDIITMIIDKRNTIQQELKIKHLLLKGSNYKYH